VRHKGRGGKKRYTSGQHHRHMLKFSGDAHSPN